LRREKKQESNSGKMAAEFFCDSEKRILSKRGRRKEKRVSNSSATRIRKTVTGRGLQGSKVVQTGKNPQRKESLRRGWGDDTKGSQWTKGNVLFKV